MNAVSAFGQWVWQTMTAVFEIAISNWEVIGVGAMFLSIVLVFFV